MIFATRPIVQIDIDLCEDGKTVMATGWTDDDNDTAIMSMEMPLTEGDAFSAAERDEAYAVTAALLHGMMLAFGSSERWRGDIENGVVDHS